MDCRLFPFTFNDSKQPLKLDQFRAELIKILDENKRQTQATIASSIKDYETTEDDSEDIAEVTTKFRHPIHGIKKYIFLSDSVLDIKFHSELEDPLSGLSPTYKRYDEHNTRIVNPPKFDKSFILIFKDESTGLLIAPFGTPTRVEYIIKDVGESLGLKFKKEITITPEQMDDLLEKLNKDNKRIKNITWVDARIVDNESHEHHGFGMGNIRNYTQFDHLRKNYNSFKLDLIKFTVRYKSGLDQTVNLILRSKKNSATLSIGFNSRTKESKNDVFQWIAGLFLQ